MATNDLDWGMEEIVLKEKKLSREQRKNEQIMRLFDKLENTNHKPQHKHKAQPYLPEKPARPRKKVKVDTVSSEKQSSCVNMHELESISTSEPHLVRERSQPSHIINRLYILNPGEDLYTHILEYGMTERAKYIDTITTTKLDLDALPASSGGLRMLPQEVLDSTNRAFSKIQNKFVELKNKLNRPTSKQHKEFTNHYLTLDYLLN